MLILPVTAILKIQKTNTFLLEYNMYFTAIDAKSLILFWLHNRITSRQHLGILPTHIGPNHGSWQPRITCLKTPALSIL